MSERKFSTDSGELSFLYKLIDEWWDERMFRIISLTLTTLALVPYAAFSSIGHDSFYDAAKRVLPSNILKDLPTPQELLVSYGVMMFVFQAASHWGYAFSNSVYQSKTGQSGQLTVLPMAAGSHPSDSTQVWMLSAGRKSQAFRLMYPYLALMTIWPILHINSTNLALDILSGATALAFCVDLILWFSWCVPSWYLFLRFPLTVAAIAAMQSNTHSIVPHWQNGQERAQEAGVNPPQLL